MAWSMEQFKYLETLPEGMADHDTVRATHRAWLQFEHRSTGAAAREKLSGVIASSRGTIKRTWTPISCKSATVKSDRTRVRLKRIQFPLVGALAMTIHKSQGSTFDEIVLDVNASQSQQLHYVGMSRVTSLDGLFLTNEKDQFVYHHGNGSDEGMVRNVRNEYARLNHHPLVTLTTRLGTFIRQAPQPGFNKLIICTINAQSLVLHRDDIASDRVLCNFDLLVITETWMDERFPVIIDGFKLLACSSCSMGLEAESSQVNDDDRASRRAAGGVAIYVKMGINILNRSVRIVRPQNWRVGDCVLMELRVGEKIILLGAVYIHPRAPKVEVRRYLRHVLSDCQVTHMRARRCSSQSDPQPVIITGDFNSKVEDDPWIIDFMDEDYGMAYIPPPHPTTIGNTTIDLTFARDLTIEVMPYVAYFSYHRPLFNRIFF